MGVSIRLVQTFGICLERAGGPEQHSTSHLGATIAVTIIVFVLVVASVLATYYYWPITTQQHLTQTWGGYVVEAPAGSVTNVTGSWVVPTVTCNQAINS